MESFLHFWRVIGYYLGLDDRFNLASRSSLSETRALLLEVGLQIVAPCMFNLSPVSIHMSKVVCKGYGIDYHQVIYSHCYGKTIISSIIEIKN